LWILRAVTFKIKSLTSCRRGILGFVGIMTIFPLLD
jgi:hypothetical protein